MDIEKAETQKELDAANADASMTGGDASTSLQSHASTASDAVPTASGDGLSGGASGSNDPLPLLRQSTDSGNGYSGGASGFNPSQPKPDKSHIAGLSLPLDSLIPPAEQQQAPKRSHRGSVGQSKKTKWTKKDWCWAGWNWGANEAYQGYYGADRMGGSSTPNQTSNAGSAPSVAAAMPGPALPKPRPYNRAYTMPAAAIDATAASMGATSKAAMPARPSGHAATSMPPAAAVAPAQPQVSAARPVGESPHWSIPAPLMPHTPITPGPPSRVFQADERLAACESACAGAERDQHLRSAVQGQAPDTPAGPRPVAAREPPPTPPTMPRPAAEGPLVPPVMPRPVPDPPSAPAIPVPAVPNVRGSPVQLLQPTIWDLTHSQVCHYRLQRGAQLGRLLRNLTQLLDG